MFWVPSNVILANASVVWELKELPSKKLPLKKQTKNQKRAAVKDIASFAESIQIEIRVDHEIFDPIQILWLSVWRINFGIKSEFCIIENL